MNTVIRRFNNVTFYFCLTFRLLGCVYLLFFAPVSHGFLDESTPSIFSEYTYQLPGQRSIGLRHQLELLTHYPIEMHRPSPTFAEESADWLIETRNELSHMIGNTGAQIDLFFAGEEVEYKANASYVRLALELNYTKRGELSLDPVFKFKLDLPTLKERLKLVVESNLPEQETLEDANFDRSLQDPNDSLASTTGAFKYLLGSIKSWEASTSIGVRLNREPNPFWRMRMKRKWDFQHHWQFKTLQSVYYFHDDSWGETTQFIFEKPIHSYFFASKSEAKWRHNERLMAYAQIFSIKKKLSPIRAIKYELGVLSQNQPNIIVTDYFIKTTYRRLLYKDWLFYEAAPGLLFSTEDSFKAKPSILMRFEMKLSTL